MTTTIKTTVKAIDLFAGLGGFTQGAIAVPNVDVVWAANHAPLAVEVHAANHPGTDHVCQDLHQANWAKVPSCDLVLASPCCQGHAKARGKDRPHHDASRSTAWAVVSCCEFHRPEAFVVENVPEFAEWKLYPAWKLAMESMGYHMTSVVLDAADLGVPQHRERLFIAGRLGSPVDISQPATPHVAIGPRIDWEWPRWSRVADKVEATRARANSGRDRFGDRFVMPYYGSGSGKTGRSLGRPLGTVTCTDRWAVVDGDRMRMLQVPEYRAAMGFPEDYQIAGSRKKQIHLLGNAVCPPVATHVVSEVVAAM